MLQHHAFGIGHEAPFRQRADGPAVGSFRGKVVLRTEIKELPPPAEFRKALPGQFQLQECPEQRGIGFAGPHKIQRLHLLEERIEEFRPMPFAPFHRGDHPADGPGEFLPEQRFIEGHRQTGELMQTFQELLLFVKHRIRLGIIIQHPRHGAPGPRCVRALHQQPFRNGIGF